MWPKASLEQQVGAVKMANDSVKLGLPMTAADGILGLLGNLTPEEFNGAMSRANNAGNAPVMPTAGPTLGGNPALRNFGRVGLPGQQQDDQTAVPLTRPTLGAISTKPVLSDSDLTAPTVSGMAPAGRSTLGTIGHVLGKIGTGAAIFADPKLAPEIPGTRQFKEREETREAGLGKTAAETAHLGAETGSVNAETQLRLEEIKKLQREATTPEQQDVLKAYSDALATGDTAKAALLEPRVKQYEAATEKPKEAVPGKNEPLFDKEGSIIGFRDAAGNLLGPNSQNLTQDEKDMMAAAKPKPLTANEEEKAISDRLAGKGLPDTPENRDTIRTALQTEKREPKDTTARDQSRSDRSYQFNSTRIADIAKDPMARADRLSRIGDTLDQGTPQADALVAPELLSVMAGGQGSGVRMNEAEISRIVGGRTQWQSIKAKLDAWRADPNKGFALTPDQRKQTRDLFDVVSQRNTQRLETISDAQQALTESDDPKEHRKIYTDLTRKLQGINKGTPAEEKPKPDTHAISISAAMKANPKATREQIEAGAKAQGFSTVP